MPSQSFCAGSGLALTQDSFAAAGHGRKHGISGDRNAYTYAARAVPFSLRTHR